MTQATPAAAEIYQPPHLPRFVTGSRATGWWGMLLVVLNESVLFATLLSSYFYMRFNSPVWPPAGIKRPELLIASINTVLLVSSSVVIWWAGRGIRQGNQSRLRIGLLAAFLLAAAFVALQGYEYARAEAGPQDSMYHSLFYLITGLHGLHVITALLMNLFVQARAWAGHFTAVRYQAVENMSLYWHFVDVVWLFVFSTVYLSPYL